MMRLPVLRMLLGVAILCGTSAPWREARAGQLRAGIAKVDVTPPELPVLINGGMLSRSGTRIKSRLFARAVAVSDGDETACLVIVDSCMLPRTLLDEAKERASKATGIPADHIAIGATHTHTAPASMGCLGTDADPRYVPFIKEKLVEAVVAAAGSLEPSEVGFAKTNADVFTAPRRWIRRPDRIALDPFGNPTVRANMHAARNPDDVTGVAGPEDPDLSLIAFRRPDGSQLCVLANFSMHYYGDRDISSDYFGIFCDYLEQRLTRGAPCLAIMSHGCSGDIWRRDYSKPPDQWDPFPTIEKYAHALGDLALSALKSVDYRREAVVRMAEARLPMKYRVPDTQRLEWARRIVAEMGDRPPRNTTEVYAREQIYLHEWQETEVVVQALRIGDIGIATTPTETYAISGLKIKAQSPLPNTIVLDLTNGGDGYIPPPEQHVLGGYNTWPARSAGLEVTAEPRIVEACLELLEEVSGHSRRPYVPPNGPGVRRLLSLRPIAYWRLEDFSGPMALDTVAKRPTGHFEPGVVFYLPGPASEFLAGPGAVNRAAMFAGGRLRTVLSTIGDNYTVSLWIWNGMPLDARPIAGWFFGRGSDGGVAAYAEQLGVGGTRASGRLVYGFGPDILATGQGVVERWQWHHVALVRSGKDVRVYLDGRLDIECNVPEIPAAASNWFFGGRTDRSSTWEGRLDEIAVFSRALTAEEIQTLAPAQRQE